MIWPRRQSPTQHPAQLAPFVLERRCENVRGDGTFTPTAAVWVTTALPASGLLREIAPEDLRVLLAVLSGVSGSGTFIATPELLAPALGLSVAATRARLQRLRALGWNGEALLTSQRGENGLHFFQPAPHLLQERHSVIAPAPAHGGRIEPPEIAPPIDARFAPGNARDEVIAHSRATYTRPRAEVEAEINRFLSPEWQKTDPDSQSKELHAEVETPPTPEAREWLRLKRALVGLGVPHHRADALLEAYTLDQIARQLEWLPYRHARSPAAYVVAAIEKDYAPPPAVSLQPAVRSKGATQQEEQQETETAVALTVKQQQEHLEDDSTENDSIENDFVAVAIEIKGIDVLSDEKDADEAP